MANIVSISKMPPTCNMEFISKPFLVNGKLVDEYGNEMLNSNCYTVENDGGRQVVRVFAGESKGTEIYF